MLILLPLILLLLLASQAAQGTTINAQGLLDPGPHPNAFIIGAGVESSPLLQHLPITIGTSVKLFDEGSQKAFNIPTINKPVALDLNLSLTLPYNIKISTEAGIINSSLSSSSIEYRPQTGWHGYNIGASIELLEPITKLSAICSADLIHNLQVTPTNPLDTSNPQFENYLMMACGLKYNILEF